MVNGMELLLPRCAGIDIGKAELAVCARIVRDDGQLGELVATFGTTTPDLVELRDWLVGLGVTDVVMESTGVYWKCVYWMLEDHMNCVLANARHVKNVPGRKTDMIDAVWLAKLLAHGLLRASFVPPRPVRDLRDLCRNRKALIADHTRQVNRLHKVLEDAGIKLACVATDIMGVSGRSMIRALIAGQTDPTVLAELAKGRMRPKMPELVKALTVGSFGDHHRSELERLLNLAERLEADIDALSTRITELCAPWQRQLELLRTIPGVDRRSAEVIISEIGCDMDRFPTAQHLASWAGICPGQNESAGKRRSATTRKGSKWLRATLIQCARAASRSNNT